MHSYHSAHGTLPFGSPGNKPITPNYPIAGTWASFLLPHLEQQNVYNLFNFNVAMNDPANAQAVTMIVNTYVCPSDPDSRSPVRDGNVGSGYDNPVKSLLSWYLGCMGPTQMDFCPFCLDTNPSEGNWCCQGYNFGSSAGAGYPAGSFAGMFGRHFRAIRFADVRDGLSNTLMVGETIPGHCSWTGAYAPNFSTTSTNIPLNTMESDFEGSVYYRSCGFKSLHPGGANFVMGDGSVHFLSQSIDFQTFNALGTRTGGEITEIP